MKKTSGKPEGHSLKSSFICALRGIFFVIRHERNMWIHIVIAVAVVAGGIILHLARPEWIMVILCIGLVFSAEIINTAVERLVDLLSPEKKETAGIVKDMTAGAVLVSAIIATAAGLLIFVPHLY